MSDEVFARSVRIERSVTEVFAWHERPGAFLRLSPPWEKIALQGEHPGIRDGVRVQVAMKVAGWPIEWEVEHRDYQAGHSFRDVMLKGPFAKWEHLHLMEPAGENACVLTDRIIYRLPLGGLGRIAGGASVRKRLNRVFAYRHAVTKTDLEMTGARAGAQGKTVLISGASGLVGQSLIPFLQTQGHRVLRLVRRSPLNAGEIYWNPSAGELDERQLAGVDAVIHLAGENVGAGRWTPRRREAILRSRVEGTRTLVAALGRMERRPRVLLSASATGFYGAEKVAGPVPADEQAPMGAGFLAMVCAEWEREARRAEALGIRTAIMRVGVVQTPAGGALAKMLPAFQMGLGGPLGSGRQGFSWIAMDDLVRAICFLMECEDGAGVFNLTAPETITQRDFARTLGQVLRRPALFPAPALGLRAAFGAMADEALLGGVQAVPRALSEAGFPFAQPTLRGALAFELGRTENRLSKGAGGE